MVVHSNHCAMDYELEIRKLPPWAVYRLVMILECGNDWKKLMALISKNNTDQPFDLKYTFEHFKLIELAGERQRRPCAEIFLEEWSTSGRKQPNLATLLQLLQKAELFRAAEYVAVELLKEPAPKRPVTGIAAHVDVSEEAIKHILNTKTDDTGLSFLEGQISESNEKAQSEEKKGLIDANHVPVVGQEGENLRMSHLDCMLHNEGVVASEHERRDEKTGSSVNRIEIRDTQQRETVRGEFHPVVTCNDQTQETLPLNEALIPLDDTIDNGRNLDAVGSSTTSLHLNTLLPHLPYLELEHLTASFCEQPLISQQGTNKGCKLGTGAFGSVYLGIYPSKIQVAVKKLKRDIINIEKQFQNEVEALSRYQHSHLLPLLGYSCDGPAYCLVYEYMSNGSLQERLACQGSTPVLSWQTRLKIALGTSQGILYLHTAYEKPLIHRDIKSANILLDQNLIPKLGDFGLVRLGANGQQSHSVALTSTVFGTSAYMAPEAFRGDVSVKLDSFSFGVVLLELLTSLPPYDEKREGCDLITHVEDICEGSIEPLLDTKAGTWGNSDTLQPSDLLYSIALDCLKEKRHRPNMDFVVECLQAIIMSHI